MQHIFIINPFTCKDKTSYLHKTIETLCTKHKLDYQIFHTETIGHATEITKKFTSKNASCIYSVGGDGTAYEVANGLQNDCKMAIIPAGTGNDFFRMNQIKVTDMEKLIEDTLLGKDILIDYALCNNKLFLNTTTLGLDARVNSLVCDLLKKTPLPKIFLYGIAAIINIFNPQPFESIVQIDGQQIKAKTILIAIMNGQFYGNGFSPTKNASIQDGYLDVCLVHDTPPFKMLRLLPKYFKGNTEDRKEVSHLKAKSISIKARYPIHIQSDGENFMSREININVQHKKLMLRVPSYSKLK